MSVQDIREIDQGKEKKARSFNKSDFQHLSQFVLDELAVRQRARRERELIWKETDRQIAMKNDRLHKLDAQGREDRRRAWIPELELPLQAQTQEVHTADIRRLQTGKRWYEAHAALTDKYLARADFQSWVTGDENEIPSKLNQDNADKIVIAYLDWVHRQYDFGAHMDRINGEAVKYGTAVGRVRMARKETLNTQMGRNKQEIPVLIPSPIKDTYLDDTAVQALQEGHFIGKATIRKRVQRYADVVLAASRGSKDPDREDGGWMPDVLKNIETDHSGLVTLVEMEGDFVIHKRTRGSIYIPKAVATVIMGTGNHEGNYGLVRFRTPKFAPSYIEFCYNAEDMSPYGGSPCMKGMPIQKAATEALNRMLMVAALHSQPPASYNPDDPFFNKEGGPNIFPGALWPTADGVNVEQIGDPQAIFAVYAGLLSQYSQVTGVNPPRLGEQTVSHTTAFAKQQEILRGQVRTVDYVQSSLAGPLTQWLDMCYELGRNNLKGTISVYSDAYGGYIDISKDRLPDIVTLVATGAGALADEQQMLQGRLQSMQLALSLDQLRIQLEAAGMQSIIDIQSAIEQTLREGGWVDLDSILKRGQEPPQGLVGGPQVGGGAQFPNPAAGVALQALASAGGSEF